MSYVISKAGTRLEVTPTHLDVRVRFRGGVQIPLRSIESVGLGNWRHIETVQIRTQDGVYEWSFGNRTREVAHAIETAAASARGKVAMSRGEPSEGPTNPSGPRNSEEAMFLAQFGAADMILRYRRGDLDAWFRERIDLFVDRLRQSSDPEALTNETAKLFIADWVKAKDDGDETKEANMALMASLVLAAYGVLTT